MSELLLTELESETTSSLEERAREHGRTPQDEAKAILRDALAEFPKGTWDDVDAIFNRVAASGRSFSDSTELLLEDRER